MGYNYYRKSGAGGWGTDQVCNFLPSRGPLTPSPLVVPISYPPATKFPTSTIMRVLEFYNGPSVKLIIYHSQGVVKIFIAPTLVTALICEHGSCRTCKVLATTCTCASSHIPPPLPSPHFVSSSKMSFLSYLPS